mgnify:CR=1 FL=1
MCASPENPQESLRKSLSCRSKLPAWSSAACHANVPEKRRPGQSAASPDQKAAAYCLRRTAQLLRMGHGKARSHVIDPLPPKAQPGVPAVAEQDRRNKHTRKQQAKEYNELWQGHTCPVVTKSRRHAADRPQHTTFPYTSRRCAKSGRVYRPPSLTHRHPRGEKQSPGCVMIVPADFRLCQTILLKKIII